MSHSHRARKRGLLALAGCLLTIAALTGTAHGEEYGELLRIGGTEAGTDPGKLNDERTRLLGVDPEGNSVFVLDEPERFSQEKREVINPETEKCEENSVTGKCVLEGFGSIARHFRIQKFVLEGKAYKAEAAATFNETSEPGELRTNAFLAGGVEGIAVDPQLKRLYVLVADDREKGLAIDESSKEGMLDSDRPPGRLDVVRVLDRSHCGQAAAGPGSELRRRAHGSRRRRI